jgi:hypothetical protein
MEKHLTNTSTPGSPRHDSGVKLDACKAASDCSISTAMQVMITRDSYHGGHIGSEVLMVG